MRLKLVECVPNFSEGRRKDVIEAIVAESRKFRVKVLDVESDADHNRTVLTFVGGPEAVKEAALAVSAKAIELIDLNKHEGQHPRMGAVDVVPFIPISEVTVHECVQLAKDFGREFAARFNVPVFLYEQAATRPDRRNLADVRKGQFEGLREEIGKNPDRIPDFGPNKIHPTAGATAIGARQILIAYNVNLDSRDVGIAKQVAKQVREKDGGLPAVKALGFELKDRGMVQVSMNMVDYKTTPLFKAFERIRSLATQYGVEVQGSEIVGLVPMDALADTAEFYLKLRNFNRKQILETRLVNGTNASLLSADLRSFALDVASDKPVPGGGSVSAYAGSLAAGLVCMVCRLTLNNATYATHHEEMKQVLEQGQKLQNQLLLLVDEDAQAFDAVMKAYRMPKTNEAEKQARSKEIQRGLKSATEAPMKVAEASSRVLELAKAVAEHGNENALSDVQTGAVLAHAAGVGAIMNVAINLSSMTDDAYRAEKAAEVNSIRERIDRVKNEVLAIAASRTAL